MSEWFDLPTTPAKFWLAPTECDNNDQRTRQMIALVLALNSHDALTTEVAKLNSVVNKIRSIITDVQDGFDVTGSDEEILDVLNKLESGL